MTDSNKMSLCGNWVSHTIGKIWYIKLSNGVKSWDLAHTVL